MKFDPAVNNSIWNLARKEDRGAHLGMLLG